MDYDLAMLFSLGLSNISKIVNRLNYKVKKAKQISWKQLVYCILDNYFLVYTNLFMLTSQQVKNGLKIQKCLIVVQQDASNCPFLPVPAPCTGLFCLWLPCRQHIVVFLAPPIGAKSKNNSTVFPPLRGFWKPQSATVAWMCWHERH